MRALLIEDDATFAGTVSRGLQEEFIDVDIANTAEAGGELARGRHYDVIVLDWGLPDRDGPSVCRGLRASQIVTPILMLSARDSLEDRATGLNAGADDYLSKTAGFEELLARIHALVQARVGDFPSRA